MIVFQSPPSVTFYMTVELESMIWQDLICMVCIIFTYRYDVTVETEA